MTASEKPASKPAPERVPGPGADGEPAPPQLGDGFSPPAAQPQAQPGESLADPAELPHPAPWSKSDF
ncbi:hypothetical protein PE066_17625 [Ramlibacter tataouinensis]|uniref:hypothetical protein n=1 Tax=Ramlibacter tataouinensis TaxID=94132 RepID=UPI0022F3D43F|nr:hypothetical protein [Ramlibacter tataouinensis]WBY01261.1 hypothetical protein PE066_17625 [Ramlibacter tataouinensis]